MKRTIVISIAVLCVAVLGGVLHFIDASPVAVFVVTGVSLGGVAWAIGIATESVGARFGPAVTGVLQSTLGNLPELFIVLFSLSAGEIVVAQFSILGSLFANALLVLGLTIVAGSTASRDGTMAFQARLPNDTATLTLLAVFLIAILGLSDQVGDHASEHQVAISVVGAVCLLVVYGAWLFDYLRSDRPAESSPEHAHEPPFPGGDRPAGGRGRDGSTRLRVVRGCDRSRRREAGDLQGIHRARDRRDRRERRRERRRRAARAKGKYDLAISVVKNSVSQISCFLSPCS